MKPIRQIINTLLLFVPLLLTGCSGGGGDEDGGIEGSGAIAGVAAVGSPITNTLVTLKSANGVTIETQTNASGAFSFQLKAGMKAPYLLKVNLNANSRLHSIVTEKVLSGSTRTANIHPLSDIAVRNWFRSRSRNIDDEFVNGVEVVNPPTSEQIEAIVNALKNLLQTAFADFSIDNNFDLISSAFDANSTEFDLLLDHTTVRLKEDKLTLRLKNLVSGLEFEAIIIFNFDFTLDLSVQDTIAPTLPTAVNVIAAGETGAVVVWNASEDNVGIAGYDIYRSDNPNTKLHTTPFPVFSDTALTTNVEICYRIEAFDGAGNKSGQTTEVCVTPQAVDNTPPATVTNLTATVIGADEIQLTWTPSLDGDVIGYDVYRATVKIATVVASSYSDINLIAATEYCYNINAFDAAANRSTDSNTVCATTSDEKPLLDTTPPSVTALPGGGVFTQPQNVALSCDDTQGSGCAGIFYTLDNTTPTTASTRYEGPITLSSNTLLKFLAADNATNQSTVITEEYTIDQTSPVSSANPPTGTYSSPQSILLSCDDGSGTGCAAIYYTIDGTQPTTSATPFSTAITISADTTLQFFAVDNAGNQESTNSLTYTIVTDDITPPNTSALPFGGTYNSSQSVTLSCDDGMGSGCATIYYTTDGSPPTINSTIYSAAISIDTDTTLRYFATDTAGNVEAAKQDDYNIVTPDALKVDVSVLSNPVKSGGRVLYNVTISNLTFQTVNNVKLLYRVPAGIRFNNLADTEPNTSANCSNLTCDENEEASWLLPTLAAGASVTIAINAEVLSGQLEGSVITAPLTLTADELNNAIVVNKSIDINSSPVAALSLSANKDPVIPGETYTLNLDLGNIKNGVLTSTQLRAFLPAGVTVNRISDGGTDLGNGEVLWDLATVGVGAALHREIEIVAPALDQSLNSDILQSRAQLSFEGGSEVDVMAEHAVSVSNTPATLLLDISTARSPAIAGSTLFYALTLSNTSFQAINNVDLLFRVPGGIQFQNLTDAEPNTSVNCSNLVCNEGEEARWRFPTLAAGQSVTININAQVLAGELNGTLISAPISVTLDEMDDTLQVVHTVPINSTASAQLSLSANKDPVISNETYTLNVDLGNIKNGVLTNTQLRAFLPAGVTVNRISDGGTDVGNGEILWNLVTVGVGAALHREVEITAPTLDQSLNSGILQSRAQLSFDGGTEVDVMAEHAVSVSNTPPTILLDISTARSPAIADNTLLYALTLSNTSFQAINNVNLLFRVPGGIQFQNLTDAEPNTSVNCSNLVCNKGEEARWTFTTLAAGQSVTININARVLAGELNGTLISTPISVTLDEMEDTLQVVHTVPINNTASARLSLSANKDPVTPNGTYTLNVDLGNISGGVLTTPQLRVLLPAGVTVNSISDNGTNLGDEVTWDLSALSVGSALHRDIVLTAPGLDASVNSGILQSRAQLSVDGGAEVDARAEHAVSVLNATPPIDVQVTATPNPVTAGNPLTHTITVSNVSALPLNNVRIVYRVPGGLQFHNLNDAEPNTSVNCSNLVCNEGEEAVWSLGTIAASAAVSITVNAQVTAGLASGTLISTPITVTTDELLDTISVLDSVSVANP